MNEFLVGLLFVVLCLLATALYVGLGLNPLFPNWVRGFGWVCGFLSGVLTGGFVVGCWQRAIEQERERCAKIADQYDAERGTQYGQLGDAAEDIAARIRSDK